MSKQKPAQSQPDHPSTEALVTPNQQTGSEQQNITKVADGLVERQVRVPGGKLGTIADLLLRPEGATLEQLTDATAWQPHSIRGAMSGSLRKKHGFAIASEKTEAGRVYRARGKARQ